jgi:hypothetical protein
MADKPEALLQRLERLGQDGVGNYGMPICAEAAAELRRLRSANVKLAGALDMIRETLHGGNVDDLLYIINTALEEHRSKT